MNALAWRFRKPELNPIVIKELRQAIRSWSITGMLLLFLVVLFGAALVMLLNQSFEATVNQELGRSIFGVFLMILAVASLVFIPAYVGIRLAAERQESNLDLLYVTTLRPGRIIRGKLLCGVYLVILFYSACMPFMVFTNLLRGIDLPSIFLILGILFVLVAAAVQVAILIACLPVSKPFKILLGLGAAAMASSLAMSFMAISSELVGAGFGGMLSTWDFWRPMITMGSIAVVGFGFVHLVSIALISPPSMNRALPLRLYATFMWAAALGGSVYWMARTGSIHSLMPWYTFSLILVAVGLVLSVSNQDQLSVRTRRQIPRSPWLRFVALFFFNGAAGGILWAAVLAALTMLSLMVVPEFLPVSYFSSFMSAEMDKLWEVSNLTATLFFYIFAYALLGLFIHRTFFPHRKPVWAGILAILIPGLWGVLPNLVYFFMNKLSWNTLEERQLGNIFNLFVGQEDGYRVDHMLFSAGFSVLMLLLNMKWFGKQSRAFKPYEREEHHPQPAAVSPAVGS